MRLVFSLDTLILCSKQIAASLDRKKSTVFFSLGNKYGLHDWFLSFTEQL